MLSPQLKLPLHAKLVIDRTAVGQPLTKTAQIMMCGNSVSPVPMRAIVAANYRELAQQRMTAQRR